VNGKALAAGIAANPHDKAPVASAIPLTNSSNDAKARSDGCTWGLHVPVVHSSLRDLVCCSHIPTVG